MDQSIVTLITVLACVAVAVILFMGLWNMFRGGDANRSQMLMRARVIAQFVALVVLLGALFFFGQGHKG
jgi:hypoxia induced protein